MGTRIETSYAIVPVSKFLELFQATVQELPALTIESFEDVDGTSFDGVVMKDGLSCKRLHVWVEQKAELIDHELRVENHLRPGQGAEVQTALRASLLQARPKQGQGAEGRSQPPSLEEIRDMVLRGRAGVPAPGGLGTTADPGPADESDDASPSERERVVEVSTVTPKRAPAPGAGGATAAGKRVRSGGGAWSTSKRPRGAVPASSASSGRAERRRVDIIDGEGGDEAGVLLMETAKLSIADILMQRGPMAKGAIYNMARASGETGEHRVRHILPQQQATPV